MTDPIQVIGAAALLAVFYMYEYWPVTLGVVVMIIIVVIQKRSGKTL